jgi:hypothetical protein
LRWPAWRVVPSSWARTSSALLFRSLVTSACWWATRRIRCARTWSWSPPPRTGSPVWTWWTWWRRRTSPAACVPVWATLTVSVMTGSLQTTSLTVMACTATTPTCVVRSFW